jgi:hypothetical protein
MHKQETSSQVIGRLAHCLCKILTHLEENNSKHTKQIRKAAGLVA